MNLVKKYEKNQFPKNLNCIENTPVWNEAAQSYKLYTIT